MLPCSVAVSRALWRSSRCTRAARSRATDPNVITLAVFASPNNFDPRVGTDEVSQKVYQLVYDNLLNLDEQLRVGPGLATRWEQPDDRTYVVYLRRGVRFHDGHELTSADVVYTFDSLIDPRSSPRARARTRCSSASRRSIATPSGSSLKEPSGSFPIQLVLPDHSRRAPARSCAPARSAPGRTRSCSYAVDDRLELAAFRDYHGGAPRNAGVVLQDRPRRDHARARAARKAPSTSSSTICRPTPSSSCATKGAMQIVQSPGTDYAYVGVNLRDPILSDRRVRQAIGYAIDRDAIVKYLRRGLARPAASVVPGHLVGLRADCVSVLARSGEVPGHCSTKPATAIRTATVPSRGCG